MKYEIKLNVSAEQFYHRMIVSILYDIQVNTKKKLLASSLHKGYCYEKTLYSKMGSPRYVKVTIDEIEKNSVLSLNYLSSMGVSNVRYVLQSKEDGFYVIYRESFTTKGYLKNLNHKLMSFLFAMQSKKKFKRLVHDIENYIMNENEQSPM